MELPIIKKAFNVYHRGMLRTYDFYKVSDTPIVHANTSGEAKSKAPSVLYDYEIDGEQHNYTDIRVKRNKSCDIVLFEGNEVKRWIAEDELKCREVERDILSLPDDEYYYVQDKRSYVGNAVLWWAQDNRGYTTDLNRAHKYTKQDIVKQFARKRETDIVWRASHVENAVREYVDGQYLKREFSV